MTATDDGSDYDCASDEAWDTVDPAIFGWCVRIWHAVADTKMPFPHDLDTLIQIEELHSQASSLGSYEMSAVASELNSMGIGCMQKPVYTRLSYLHTYLIDAAPDGWRLNSPAKFATAEQIIKEFATAPMDSVKASL